ncbi:uncharacterized protein LOC124620229 [Schistocerca americana]|uniref:uncharacterized protein LOC124620229 n=1 Tax=Schistocerca americana TaxID=7009 RepID=UPI001F4F6BC3|nr:uncharacterized protein LOC124620229 [Schistocerca americana]
MTTTAQEVRLLVGPVASALEWLGMLQLPGSPPLGLRALMGVLVVTMGLLLFIPSALLLLVDPPSNAETYREVFFLSVASTTWWVKAVFFMLERTRLEELMSILVDSTKRFPEDGSGIRRKYHRRAAMLSLAWQAAPVLSLPTWMMIPMLERHYVTHGNITEVYRRPMFYMLTPGNGLASPNYEIIYVVQCVAFLIAVEGSVLMDIYFVNIMIKVTSELELLNVNLARMRLCTPAQRQIQSVGNIAVPEYSHTRSGHSKANYFFNKTKTLAEEELHDSALIDENTSGASEEFSKLYKSLVKNVRHHQRIIV